MEFLDNLETQDVLGEKKDDQNTHFFSATQVGDTVVLTYPITLDYPDPETCT